MSITLKEHLNRIRKIGHETQKKNGQYSRMGFASAKARKKRPPI